MKSQVTLIVDEGTEGGQRVLSFTSPQSCIVGRAPDANLRLRTDRAGFVSRRHCLLDINPPNIRVCDLGSLNGTFVNGANIGRRQQRMLENEPQEYHWHTLYAGDVISIGMAKIRVVVFRVADDPQPTYGRRRPPSGSRQ